MHTVGPHFKWGSPTHRASNHAWLGVRPVCTTASGPESRMNGGLIRTCVDQAHGRDLRARCCGRAPLLAATRPAAPCPQPWALESSQPCWLPSSRPPLHRSSNNSIHYAGAGFLETGRKRKASANDPSHFFLKNRVSLPSPVWQAVHPRCVPRGEGAPTAWPEP